MAPLRSSRHTRNAEHNAPARNRAGIVDYDPTDGLPVRKYVYDTVKINQDTAAEATEPGTKAQIDKDDGTYYPWDDMPLPSFFDQLPIHNQELIRRARQGNRAAKLCVWDRKTNEWVKYEKAKQQGLVGNVMKSRHLMNVDADEGENDDDEADEEDDDEEMADGPVLGAAIKKRKVATSIPGEDRTFEVRRWVPVPADKADKMAEPKYLADRRPGMPSLYTNAAVLKQASGYGAPVTAVNEYSGIDLGDGSGLGNALGPGGAGRAPGEATPVRRNIPPKRKKKKGGPGRKKAVPVPVEGTEQTAAVEVKGEMVEKPPVDGEKKEGDDEGEGEEGSGDESEGEGSEEGEVNEEPPAAPAPVPQVIVEAVAEEVPVAAADPVVPALVQKKPIEAVVQEVTVTPASPEKKEVEMDLLGGLEAELEKQSE